ncbi:MAG: cholesterol oxidase [Bacteroidia bacterium]|jgi:cholesterol oxidase
MLDDKIYDHIVIGSGFGGSVSAMRLSEKGYDVLVIEMGKRWASEDFPKTNWNVRKFLWAPAIRAFGIQKIDFLNKIMVLGGAGVGGGSLVYANTHMFPPDTFFNNPVWSGLRDWKSTLAPFYEKARFMLGSTKYDKEGPEDKVLEEIAADMNQSGTYKPVDHVGVYLGDRKVEKDPYFNGLGPMRKGCIECANCMVGCRYNSKNTLDKNYLYFAEKWGAKIEPETKVTKVELIDEVYHIHTESSTSLFNKRKRVFKSRGVVFSAGVLGTMKLLFRQKQEFNSLPNLSDKLGGNLRTNSESLCGIAGIEKKMNHGLAISRVFNPDENTHIELVKYGDGSGAMGLLSVMAAGDGPAFVRTMKMLWNFVTSPRKAFNVVKRDFAHHSIILLVMQSLDNALQMKWSKGIFGGSLKVADGDKNQVPAFIGIGQDVMHRYAEKTGGTAMNATSEVLFNMSSTAHILGGCPMGQTKETGVVNDKFEVHGYPNMYVLDGSIIPCNLGVNPSLTITALSEYAMSLVPQKEGNTRQTLEQQMQEISV